MTVTEDLGEIQLIKIEKRKYWFPDDWYLKYVTVKTPMGDYLEFPCYRWITDDKEVVLRDGRGECFAVSLTKSTRQSQRTSLLSSLLVVLLQGIQTRDMTHHPQYVNQIVLFSLEQLLSSSFAMIVHQIACTHL